MKKSDLKRIIKPIVKECILESLIEEGILSSVISEVMQGVNASSLVNSKETPPQTEQITEQQMRIKESQYKEALDLQRKRLNDAITADAYGGVNLFEGTKPLATGGSEKGNSQPHSALSNMDPNDSGVDISGIMNVAAGSWKALVK